MKLALRQVILSIALVIGMGLTARLQSEDLTGKWGVSGIAQAAFPVGQKSVKDQARDVGPDLGGLVRYGISSHWSAGVSYENLDLGHGIRVEPINATGIYSFMPNSRWTPTALVGVGTGRGVDTKIYNDLTAKAALGLDYFVMPNVAIGPQVAYHYISDTGTESRRHAHVLTAGLMASLFFGGEATAAPAKAASPKAAAVPPPPAPVALVLNPSSAVLSEGQTQTLNATVTGAANTGVSWSLSPSLGTISDTGLYTAPSTVAIRQDVVVTARAVADSSKSASSTITLQPAKPAEKVSITLDVLFDTAKAVIKPQYDAEIKKVTDFMATYTGANAEIEGHTDNVGDAAYNQGLSQRRAEAVRQYLIDQYHLDAARLTAKGYGETQPIADNSTKEGRAKNRRVVATLTATKG